MIENPTTADFGKESWAKKAGRMIRLVKASNREKIREIQSYLREKEKELKDNPLKCPHCKKYTVGIRVKKENNPNGLGEIFKTYAFCNDCGHGTKKWIEEKSGDTVKLVSGYWDVSKKIKKTTGV